MMVFQEIDSNFFLKRSIGNRSLPVNEKPGKCFKCGNMPSDFMSLVPAKKMVDKNVSMYYLH
jgi:hypothetical protein